MNSPAFTLQSTVTTFRQSTDRVRGTAKSRNRATVAFSTGSESMGGHDSDLMTGGGRLNAASACYHAGWCSHIGIPDAVLCSELRRLAGCSLRQREMAGLGDEKPCWVAGDEMPTLCATSSATRPRRTLLYQTRRKSSPIGCSDRQSNLLPRANSHRSARSISETCQRRIQYALACTPASVLVIGLRYPGTAKLKLRSSMCTFASGVKVVVRRSRPTEPGGVSSTSL